jgi:hypothetical protein
MFLSCVVAVSGELEWLGVWRFHISSSHHLIISLPSVVGLLG